MREIDIGSASMIGLEKCFFEGIPFKRNVFLTRGRILGLFFKVSEHVSIGVGVFGFRPCFLDR